MELFNKEKNINLTSLNLFELYSLFSSIYKYKLILRDELLISNDFYFSPEIEFVCRSEEHATKLFQDELNNNWNLTWESSIGNGYELKPDSFLLNKTNDYLEIKDILYKIQKDIFTYIDYRCGLHINIGAHIFDNDEHFHKFVLLWLAYEEVIYRFCYGTYYNPRKDILKMAYPLRIGLEDLDTDNLIEEITFYKNAAFSTKKMSSYDYKYNNILEIRCPNATLNPIVVQNNINMFSHMIEYTRNDINIEELKNNINRKKDIEFVSYNKIFINESLDFADKIFDNSLDKIYFLKQYLKGGKEVEYDADSMKMIKYKKL